MCPLEQGRSTAAIANDNSFPLKSLRFEIKEYLSKPNWRLSKNTNNIYQNPKRPKKSPAQ